MPGMSGSALFAFGNEGETRLGSEREMRWLADSSKSNRTFV